MAAADDIINRRLVEMAAAVEIQLGQSSSTAPLLYLISEARKRAINAIGAILEADPANTEVIRANQNEVSIYERIVEDIKNLIAEGRERDRLMTEDERREIASYILSDEDARAAGIPPRYDS